MHSSIWTNFFALLFHVICTSSFCTTANGLIFLSFFTLTSAQPYILHYHFWRHTICTNFFKVNYTNSFNVFFLHYLQFKSAVICTTSFALYICFHFISTMNSFPIFLDYFFCFICTNMLQLWHMHQRNLFWFNSTNPVLNFLTLNRTSVSLH